MLDRTTLLKELEEIKSRLQKLESALEEKCSKERWKRPRAEKGGEYFIVSGSVGVYRDTDDMVVVDISRYDSGNYWLHKESAENAVLRIKSMNPVMPEPKVGDKVFEVYLTTGRNWTFLKTSYTESYTTAYLFGRLHPTEESAHEWIEKYSAAWTTVPKEFKS